MAIDRALFQELAGSPADGLRMLDELLRGGGLLRGAKERTIAEGSRGALRLWKLQIASFAMQTAALAAGIILQAAGM